MSVYQRAETRISSLTTGIDALGLSRIRSFWKIGKQRLLFPMEQHRLLKAASEGNAEAVRAVLAQGADANARNMNGMTALMKGIDEKHPDVVQVLLDHGADVNLAMPQQGYDAGYTALVVAVKRRHVGIVQLLLNHGANVSARTGEGSTALTLAATDRLAEESVRCQIMELLLAHGAKIDATDDFGMTPLMYAASNDHSAMAQLLLDRGAEVNLTAAQGYSASWTALVMAVRKRHVGIVQLLSNHGADVDARTSEGSTVLCLAAARGFVEASVQCQIMALLLTRPIGRFTFDESRGFQQRRPVGTSVDSWGQH